MEFCYYSVIFKKIKKKTLWTAHSNFISETSSGENKEVDKIRCCVLSLVGNILRICIYFKLVL